MTDPSDAEFNDIVQLMFEGDGFTLDDDRRENISSEQVDPEGRICSRCKEYYPYAHSNQLDGSFKCWGCRH